MFDETRFGMTCNDAKKCKIAPIGMGCIYTMIIM